MREGSLTASETNKSLYSRGRNRYEDHQKHAHALVLKGKTNEVKKVGGQRFTHMEFLENIRNKVEGCGRRAFRNSLLGDSFLRKVDYRLPLQKSCRRYRRRARFGRDGCGGGGGDVGNDGCHPPRTGGGSMPSDLPPASRTVHPCLRSRQDIRPEHHAKTYIRTTQMLLNLTYSLTHIFLTHPYSFNHAFCSDYHFYHPGWSG